MAVLHVLLEPREHAMSTWPHRNALVSSNVVNLIVFVFFMTALVFVTRVNHNREIRSYPDAPYFTIGTLTTVGLGVVTLPDTVGRLITIAVMVLGLTAFLELIRAIAIGDKMRWPCPACGLPLHDRDAAHC
ncbi:MAG: potassium channel family protein [Hyphomonadaceae bacterium]